MRNVGTSSAPAATTTPDPAPGPPPVDVAAANRPGWRKGLGIMTLGRKNNLMKTMFTSASEESLPSSNFERTNSVDSVALTGPGKGAEERHSKRDSVTSMFARPRRHRGGTDSDSASGEEGAGKTIGRKKTFRSTTSVVGPRSSVLSRDSRSTPEISLNESSGARTSTISWRKMKGRKSSIPTLSETDVSTFKQERSRSREPEDIDDLEEGEEEDYASVWSKCGEVQAVLTWTFYDYGHTDFDTRSISVDDLTTLVAAYIPKDIQISVEFLGRWKHVRISPMSSGEDAIHAVLEDMRDASDTSDRDPARYRICRMDRNVPGLRKWMDREDMLAVH
ncbi:hypothetical protein HK104_006385, partial [Borealophlyctis nickersoniae]